MKKLGTVIALAILAGASFARAQEAREPAETTRKVTNWVQPSYPDLAKRLRLQGTVKLVIVVRANGSVKSMKALGGSPLLVQAAADAVNKWRFEPSSNDTTEIIQLAFHTQ